MTKNELNKAWAELEGQEYPDSGWQKVGGEPIERCPDWTEPNRFFAEVVPRMRKLGFRPSIYNHADNTWSFRWVQGAIVDAPKMVGDVFGEAGLKSAIQARKEVNDTIKVQEGG